jgi:transcriptional regulator with XRE-family HTH domain
MTKRFDRCLKEARARARLSQRALSEKVGIADSYISRMETGAFPPPSRDVTVKLADALGMSGRPVTLYLSKKDIDTLERFVFFLAACVAGAEDVEEIRIGEVEEEEQGSGATTYTVAHPSVKLPARFVGAKVEEIEQLIASGGYSEEEEEEVWGALVEMVKRFNSFKEMQRKARKEG